MPSIRSPAWVYRTSPFELILQVPKIGAPYNHEPIVWIFPLWTYSQNHDHLVAWSLALVWGMLIVGAENVSPPERKLLYVCSGLEVGWLVFSSGWHFGVATRLFNPAGIGWIYVSTGRLLAWTVVPAVLFAVLLPGSRSTGCTFPARPAPAVPRTFPARHRSDLFSHK